MIPLPIDPAAPRDRGRTGRAPRDRRRGAARRGEDHAGPARPARRRRPDGAERAAAGATAGEILVLQPRRLPARLGAARVAEELGERVGRDRRLHRCASRTVGGPRTRLRFVTEGILTRRLLARSRAARGLRRWCSTSSTSATWRPIWRWRCSAACQLGRAPRSRSCASCRRPSTPRRSPPTSTAARACAARGGASTWPSSTCPSPTIGRSPCRSRAPSGARLREGPPGDVLVFLPGAAEIRRCEEALGRAGARRRPRRDGAARRSAARGAGARGRPRRRAARSSCRRTWPRPR